MTNWDLAHLLSHACLAVQKGCQVLALGSTVFSVSLGGGPSQLLCWHTSRSCLATDTPLLAPGLWEISGVHLLRPGHPSYSLGWLPPCSSLLWFCRLQTGTVTLLFCGRCPACSPSCLRVVFSPWGLPRRRWYIRRSYCVLAGLSSEHFLLFLRFAVKVAAASVCPRT